MEYSANERNWRILLLGGSSGVGKTSVSYRLARHFGVALTEVDDFQLMLKKMTTPEQLPLLHFWHTNREEFEQWTVERKLAHFIRVCQEVFSPALEAVIANHLESNTPVVLEGDFILPALATLSQYDDAPANGQVKGLFIYEEDETQIARNYGLREGDEQSDRAHTSWVISEWLRQECERLGIPAVASRPWGTVLERAIAAISE